MGHLSRKRGYTGLPAEGRVLPFWPFLSNFWSILTEIDRSGKMTDLAILIILAQFSAISADERAKRANGASEASDPRAGAREAEMTENWAGMAKMAKSVILPDRSILVKIDQKLSRNGQNDKTRPSAGSPV